MSKAIVAALLVVLFGSGSALAKSFRCFEGYDSARCGPPPPYYVEGMTYWGYALPHAEPQDPTGRIVLEGAAGGGAPDGDW
ncbi:hypothetical protein F7D13_16220 [Methylocystis rosea]|uniref:Uncharacterized protein n=1 Tax=Methylocystis rosea TaxID=173366 RepID=A0ABX6EL07_9HYPH|nr:hypothetical protein [Methylocystis rosea]QGM95458.1 hypothetical protein F7D13_16220 [Methylocystis rosea]